MSDDSQNVEKISRLASEIAGTLGVAPIPNKRTVDGEGCAPLKIPLHTEEFWCFATPSEQTFRFTAECRKRKVDAADFAITLPTQEGFTEHCPSISASLGVPVFGNKLFTEEEIASHLLTLRLLPLLRQVDFEAISRFTFSPTQLHVTSDLRDVAWCAAHARIFRDLIVAAYREAVDRSEKDEG
jgi:hypothetical protein